MARDIQQFIANNSLDGFVLGNDERLFIGTEPIGFEDCVTYTLYDLDGGPSPVVGEVDAAAIRIRVRGRTVAHSPLSDTYTLPLQRLRSLSDAIQQLGSFSVDIRYSVLALESGPELDGRDEQNRYVANATFSAFVTAAADAELFDVLWDMNNLRWDNDTLRWG